MASCSFGEERRRTSERCAGRERGTQTEAGRKGRKEGGRRKKKLLEMVLGEGGICKQSGMLVFKVNCKLEGKFEGWATNKESLNKNFPR